MDDQSSLTICETAAPQSSVQIETRAKGAPAITVKIYHADPAEAARIAREQYDALVAAYATPTTD